jgi:hypothetical protein
VWLVESWLVSATAVTHGHGANTTGAGRTGRRPHAMGIAHAGEGKKNTSSAGGGNRVAATGGSSQPRFQPWDTLLLDIPKEQKPR